MHHFRQVWDTLYIRVDASMILEGRGTDGGGITFATVVCIQSQIHGGTNYPSF